MRFVAQRVSRAALSVNGVPVSEIGCGLVVYFGVKVGDTEAQAKKCVEKLIGLRIFEDEAGKMNRSVLEVGGEILFVSQFTLLGDCTHGNRPSFTEAERPERAKELYDYAFALLSARIPAKRGVFGADMHIEQVNEGPVTILFEV